MERAGITQKAKAHLADNPKNTITHRIIEYSFFFYKKVFLHAKVVN